MKKGRSIFLIIVLSGFLFFIANAQALMVLSFESSVDSWVGQGRSFTVSPDDGYIFNGGIKSYDNSLNFNIFSLNSPFGPDWDPRSGEEYHYWTLNLAAPYDQPLEVGSYYNTARYPFQDDSQPGLTFSGDHRGNNRNGGFFDVLEIGLDGQGYLDSFAVNFTQYGEENPDWWINGQLRFNSDIPLSAAVPEPATILLLGVGFFGLICIRTRKNEFGVR